MKKYDIFISSKSEDYSLAEGVCDFLEANGLKVFIASRELQKIGEAQYAKAIDEVLDNSAHMIVVASSLENIKSKWVEYEWSLFSNDLKSGYREGNLITILSDAVELKTLPGSLRHQQSFNLNTYKNHILDYLRVDSSEEGHNSPNQETIIFSNGDRYVGEVRNGYHHGLGTLYFTNGSRYVGEFKDGKPYGSGILYCANGNRYEGEFKDGKRHGHGIFYWNNGNRYEGEFKDGKRHGLGTFYFADGNSYEGQFIDNNAHGYGTFYFADGNSYVGKFNDYKRHRHVTECCTNRSSLYRQSKFNNIDKNQKSESYNYVDLGLSVCWATTNIGAFSPEEFGDYFAWGEVSPKIAFTKENYAYYNIDEDKFIDIGSEISGTEYDVARQRRGENWRMPTLSEYIELRNKCKWIWTKKNNIFGRQIIGPNNNSIFIPAAGSYKEESPNSNLNKGRYWTGTKGNIDDRAELFGFSSMEYGWPVWTNYRYYGNPIRPVYDKSKL